MNKIEKHARDMDFGEILNLLKGKEFDSIKFKRLDKPFDSWDKFLEEHASGQEVHKQWMGMHEFTFIWKGNEKYPFAYAFPKLESEDGFYFYIKQ